MADTETTVKIKGDTKGLRDVERASKKAFSPQAVEAYQQKTRALEKDLRGVSKQQADLVLKLKGVEKGSDAYKKLGKEIKDVKTEADSLKTTLDSLNRGHKELDQRTQRNAQRRQGFVAGVAQGAGVAQYMPTGPGMKSRMAGAMVGRGMRRAGRGGMGFMPMGGGLSTMFQSVPMGGLISGALEAAQGMFQEAVAFQQSRLENLPYAVLGGRMANPEYAAAQEAVKLQKGLLTQAKDTRDVRRLKRGQELTKRRKDAIRVLNQKRMLQKMQGDKPVGSAVFGAAVRPAEDITKTTSREKADLKRYEQDLQKAEKVLAGTPETVKTSTFLPTVGFGAKFGFAAQQTQQLFGQYMGARGGISSRRNLFQFKEAIAAQRLYGISAGTAGAFQRAYQPGAGGMGRMGLAGAVGAAQAQGLQGTQVVEYLQQLVQHAQTMEKQGIKFDYRNLTQSATMMGGLGLKGLQAQRVSGGLQAAARGVSAKGVQSPVDIMLARAAGFDPEGGAESYAAAMNKLAGGMTPEVMASLLGQMTQGAGAGGRGPEMRKMLMRRVMGKAGVAVGPEMAQTIMSGFREGKFTEEARAKIDTMLAKSRGMTAQGMIGQARAGAGRVGGAAVTAAEMEAGRIGRGSQKGIAKIMWDQQKAIQASVTTLGRFSGVLGSLSDAMLFVIQKIDQVAQKQNWYDTWWNL